MSSYHSAIKRRAWLKVVEDMAVEHVGAVDVVEASLKTFLVSLPDSMTGRLTRGVMRRREGRTGEFMASSISSVVYLNQQQHVDRNPLSRGPLKLRSGFARTSNGGLKILQLIANRRASE